MDIAALLFTYNRSYHTEQVIQALKRSSVLPHKLFVFQDGMREDTNSEEWEKVASLIHNIDWCKHEIITSEYNKGLADSIVLGINYALEEYDAVIVLEDDCVPMPGFIQFMTQCFETYEKDKRVYAVSGYAWPVSLESVEYDAYFCGRISSWGWGTWKDRWEEYIQDYEMIRNLKKSKEGSRQLALWGSDLERQLIDRVRGENDSWAVFWALKVIEKRGLCVNPYVSLIDNIGHDGTGVHCGVSERFIVSLDGSGKSEYKLPIEYCDMQVNESAFTDLWTSYTALTNESHKKKERVLIYGLGNFFMTHEREINEKYEIVAFVDRKKQGFYAGKEIIKADQISKLDYSRIYIAIQDMRESLHILGSLCETYAVPSDRIIIGTQHIS